MIDPADRELEVFSAARRLPPEQRAAYLDESCADNAELRRRVEELLRAGDDAAGFLATKGAPPRGPGGTIRIEIASEIKPGDRIGRYKLLEQLGEGGCGVVYVAEQEQPVRRRVALKVIKLGMDTRQVIARFEAERQALALMDHPNIAKVLDAGATETGRPFFVMELVKGIPITRYCDEHLLETQARLNLFIQVCQAVQHAHQKGIIHRDIKPSNILVADHDGLPVPKVIDFGIAKATTDQRLTDKTIYTAIEQFIGTPAYMSPEQANLSGLDIDTRSDIYSLGVLLYELLTGRTPFDAHDLVKSGLDAIRRTIREVEPPRPSTRLSTLQGDLLTATAKQHGTESVHLLKLVRGDLDWIVMKCLEKDRARRYETANGLSADLKRHLTNEPVIARPPSASYKFQKAIRRNKLAFSAAAAVALALVVGLAIAAIGLRKARVEKDNALRARAGEVRQRKAAEVSAHTAQEQRQRAETEKAQADHLLYVANMNVAQGAWDENNIERVRQVLEDTATNSERGFEWYYWQRQLHLDLMTLRGHLGPVNSVAFSPDGRHVLTGSSDATGRVWDAVTGKDLLVLKGHSGVDSVAFSTDGRRIVTGSEDGTAQVWDAASGRVILTLNGHAGAVCAAFSPDGNRIVTGSNDHVAKVWDAANGKELLTFKGHAGIIYSVCYSPDGRRIVTGSEDGTAQVWDAASGRVILTLNGHDGSVSAVFSPDGQRIVTGCQDHVAKVWDAASGKYLLTLWGHTGGVRVAFSPDSKRIVTGSNDHTAKVWDAVTGKEILTLKGHSDTIDSVAFSPDGRRIVTSNRDHTAKVWDAANNKELLTFKGHRGRLNTVSFSPDGERIVTGSEDSTAKVWDTRTGEELFTLQDTRGIAAIFSPDGKQILTCAADGTSELWDAGTRKKRIEFKQSSGGGIAFSPDGRRIVLGSTDGTVNVWESATGKKLLILKGHSGGVWSADISRDGRRIVTGSQDKTAKVWDADTGKELLTIKGNTSAIDSVAFSPGGQQVATGCVDGTVKLWDSTNGNEILSLKGHIVMAGVLFSPNGERILTTSDDYTTTLWDAVCGRELLTLNGNAGPVNDAAFSPDGYRIATANAWGPTAIIWEAATPQQVNDWQAEERKAEFHPEDKGLP